MTTEEKHEELKKCYATCDMLLRAFGAKTSALLNGQVSAEPEDLTKFAEAAFALTEEITRNVAKGVAIRKELENPILIGV